MELAEIKRDVRKWKEFGTQSKFPIHVSVLESLIREVEAYRAMPKLIKDAARGLSYDEPIAKGR